MIPKDDKASKEQDERGVQSTCSRSSAKSCQRIKAEEEIVDVFPISSITPALIVTSQGHHHGSDRDVINTTGRRGSEKHLPRGARFRCLIGAALCLSKCQAQLLIKLQEHAGRLLLPTPISKMLGQEGPGQDGTGKISSSQQPSQRSTLDNRKAWRSPNGLAAGWELEGGHWGM